KLPVKYLGAPLVLSRLLYRDCSELMEKVKSSMHLYWALVFILPTRLMLELEQVMGGFLWCHSEKRRGKAKVAWVAVCLPKREGGLGIFRLEAVNMALITSQIWSLLTCKESLWVKWIHTYKLKGRSFWEIPLRGKMSWGWCKILQVRQMDSSVEETETESNVWDDGSEDVNPFGGGNRLFHGDEEEEYSFVNKYPSLKEEPIVLVEEESCPVYDTDNEAEESMSVYDIDIEDVIEEEEGFFNNPHCNIPKALPVDVGCITIASIVSTPVNFCNLLLPIVYHVPKREPNTFSGLIVPKANSPCSPVGEGSSASLAFADSQGNSSLNSDKDCHEIEELSASEEDQGHHETSDYDN
nr:hypothetical protein [Tanacetum cinerariifolium]